MVKPDDPLYDDLGRELVKHHFGSQWANIVYKSIGLGTDFSNFQTNWNTDFYKDNLGEIWPKPTLLDFGPSLYKDNLGKNSRVY